jgi:hypothetical protein
MNVLWTVLVVIGLLGLTALGLSLRIVKQYERGCSSGSAGSSAPESPA